VACLLLILSGGDWMEITDSPRAGQGKGELPGQKDSEAGHFVLRLYIAGHAPNSERALANLNLLCSEYLAGRFQVEVIDVLENPSMAISDQIRVTPTLLRLSPEPVVRIIGNLSRTASVLDALGIPGGSGPVG
jgi:circadian clock protein KaiB